MANDKPKRPAPQDHKPKARQAAVDLSGEMKFRYAGTEYAIPYDPDAYPRRVDRELFHQSGFSVRGWMISMADIGAGQQVGDFLVVVMVWLGKRLAGEPVRYEQLEDTFDTDLFERIDDEVDEGPKASA